MDSLKYFLLGISDLLNIWPRESEHLSEVEMMQSDFEQVGLDFQTAIGQYLNVQTEKQYSPPNVRQQ